MILIENFHLRPQDFILILRSNFYWVGAIMESTDMDCFSCPALKLCTSNIYKFVSLQKGEPFQIRIQKNCLAIQGIFELISAKETPEE